MDVMSLRCPRCLAQQRKSARFCSQCGLQLPRPGDPATAGCVPHATPLPAPADWSRVQGARDLAFRWESAWGGRPAGIEGVAAIVHNGGYPLRCVVLRLIGHGGDGQERLRLERIVPELPRGRETRIEVPSFELTAPLAELKIELVSADFAPEA